MKQGKRVQKKEKTKQAILKAALELFAAKGFYATTTKAISKKAQIAEGTLFNYFETKEDLALYFFEEELAGVMEWHQANRRLKNADIAENLFAIIQHLLERLGKLPPDESAACPSRSYCRRETLRSHRSLQIIATNRRRRLRCRFHGRTGRADASPGRLEDH